MKRMILLLLLFHSAASQAIAQGINNKWFCFTNSVIDFSSGTPVLVSPPNNQPSPPLTNAAFPGYYPGEAMGAQTAVCDTNGNLLFFVKILTASNNNGLLGNVYPGWAKIFDKNGYSMPNSDINASWEDHTKQPLIVPYPGKPNLYYLFYTKNGGLQYALVDMNLNNGLGAVVPNEKDILLSSWGTVNGTQLMAVAGCRGIWLIIHSASYNRYYSYLINEEGVNPNPIISDCGLLPLQDYGWPGGRLVASPDGKHLAMGTKEGIELYDFQKCSGKMSNLWVIDSTNYFGLCFSPDGSRLYASQVYPNNQGLVYQFDMTQNSPSAITASKTLVIANPIVLCVGIFGTGPITSLIGDLKLGPDGQIYMSNNITLCDSTLPMPPATALYKHHGLHVIHNPNALGLACNPELNVLALNTPQGYSFENSGGGTGLEYFSANVVSPPLPPETVPGATIPVTVCFKETTTLHASPGGACYLWDDSSTNQSRVVDTDGIYWVRYFKDCTVTTDTYRVRFIPLPEFAQLNYGCPGAINIDLKNKVGDTIRHSYQLMDSAGQTIDVQEGSSDVSFGGLDTGHYNLSSINQKRESWL